MLKTIKAINAEDISCIDLMSSDNGEILKLENNVCADEGSFKMYPIGLNNIARTERIIGQGGTVVFVSVETMFDTRGCFSFISPVCSSPLEEGEK